MPETSLSSATFFKTESDFKQAVNGAYVPLRSIANDRAWVLGEMHSDNTYYPRNTLFGAVDNTENVADFAVPTANGITTNTQCVEINTVWIIKSLPVPTRFWQQLMMLILMRHSKNNLKGQAYFPKSVRLF